MPRPAHDERRITLHLLRVWMEACKGRLMPGESDIDQQALAHLSGHCFLISTSELGPDGGYRFSHLGADIQAAYDSGMMDEGRSVVISPEAKNLALSFQQVIRTAAPVVSEGEFTNASGIIHYRQCLLPLGEGEAVTAIMGGLSIKSH